VRSHPGEAPPWASGVCAGLHAAGARHVVSVPDNPTSHIVRVLQEQFPAIRLTTATREEEALGIAAGLYLGGTRPAVMMQSSGLGNSLNVLTSLLIPYRIPALMLISMRGEAGEWNPAQMPMGRAVRPIFDALEILYVTIDRPEDAAPAIESTGRRAFDARRPAACLLPRRLTVPGAAA
jgi:sulfopyruvate decarboxylase alpha subunit